MQYTKSARTLSGVLTFRTLKYLLVMFTLIGVGVLLAMNIHDVYALTISPEDNPENIAEATNGGYGDRQLVRTIVNFALFIILFASVISTVVGIIYLIVGKVSYQDNLDEIETLVQTDKT